jgi:hypothetical protein
LLDPLRTRRFFLAGVAVGVIVMSAAGLAAARLIQSPDQLAARTTAPALSVITGVAGRRMLRNGIVVPGTVRPGHTVAVTAAAPYTAVIVTKMPVKLGHRVWPGHVIAQIDGRPILLLRGKLPPYRDLRQGETGPDVTQLQTALIGVGYADYDPAGYFGPSTALAVRLLYQHLGYSPPLYRPKAPKHRHHGTHPPRPQRPRVYLPMNEVIYIPTASALVVAVNAKAGTTVSPGQVVLRLATGHPYVTGMLSARQAALARIGSAAQIRLANPHIADTGTVTGLGAIPAYASHGSGRIEYPVDVTVHRPLPEGLIGTTVRLTVWSAVTRTPVLTVPLAAVFRSPPGKPRKAGRAPVPATYVTTLAADGRSRRIPVLTGPAAGGFVAVQPARPAALQPGDHVVIGVGR